MQTPPTVLVTGGSGFLGAQIVRQLQQSGYAVNTLQRNPSQPRPGVADYAGDVCDAADLTRALDGASCVIHAAGLAHVFDPSAHAPFREINEIGTAAVSLAAVAASVRHLVHVSSVSVYGGCDAGGGEDARLVPDGPYAASKAAAELRAIAAVRGTTTRLTILRLATLYGPGDRGNVQRLIEAVASGRFVWLGRGTNRKSLIHVEDAARACILPLGSDGAAVEIYNVSAPAIRMRDVVDTIAGALGKPAPGWYLPAALVRAAGSLAAAALGRRGRSLRGVVTKWLNDDVYPGDRFAARFDFEPRIPLEDGIREQVAHARATGAVDS